MKILITGGCGFLGSNLSEEVLQRGDELFIFDNLSRSGSEENLKWLKSKGKFKHYNSDIRSYNDVETSIIDCKPDVIFHLAGQVAMTTSLSNPRLDFEINVLGGNNLLESVRKHQKYAIITYSSTNKVYGDLEWLNYTEKDKRYLINEFPSGLDEKIPLDFQSPYGCSKGATDQYMLDYAKMFDIQTVVFRHSSIFGGRQFPTEDQGWVGWFIKKALEIKNGMIDNQVTISGNGKQVRDILFAEDLKKCYFMAIENISSIKGHSFNIGGGFENSLSLLELFDILNKELDIEMHVKQTNWRISDQKVFIANCDKAKREFNWEPEIKKNIGISSMIEWVKSK